MSPVAAVLVHPLGISETSLTNLMKLALEILAIKACSASIILEACSEEQTM